MVTGRFQELSTSSQTIDSYSSKLKTSFAPLSQAPAMWQTADYHFSKQYPVTLLSLVSLLLYELSCRCCFSFLPLKNYTSPEMPLLKVTPV